MSMVTSIFIAENTFSKNSRILSTVSFFFRALMIAGLLLIPRNPVEPFSITSTSILSLVVPSLIEASVIASSTVFAETSINSIVYYPLYLLFLSLNSRTLLALEARLPAFALLLTSAACSKASSFSSFVIVPDSITFAFVLIFAALAI